METRCTVHLRAWLLEEIEFLLQNQTEQTILWAETLLAHLWRDIPLRELVIEASIILPNYAFERFLIFAARNYPKEIAASAASILSEYASIAAAGSSPQTHNR